MKLTVLSSNSKGNCYLIHNKNEALIIEAGLKFNDVMIALNFNIEIISGCIVSHEHGDHASKLKEYLSKGINGYCSKGTYDTLNFKDNEKIPTILIPKETVYIENFKVLPFSVKHDAKEPLGFLINHSETGNILFITDSSFVNYNFKNINNIILEVNFVDEIVDNLINSAKLAPCRYARIIDSHMGLNSALRLLGQTDLSNVNNIVLCHLSRDHADKSLVLNRVISATGKLVFIAEKNLSINFNKSLI
jgi:phosphoribosyl 1,2-cyclic phosphodiesterase